MSTTFPESLTAFRDSFADLNDAEIANLAKVSIEETAAYRAFLVAEAAPEATPEAKAPPAEEPTKKATRNSKPKDEAGAATPPKPTAKPTPPPEVKAPTCVRVVKALRVGPANKPRVYAFRDVVHGAEAARLWREHPASVECFDASSKAWVPGKAWAG